MNRFHVSQVCMRKASVIILCPLMFIGCWKFAGARRIAMSLQFYVGSGECKHHGTLLSASCLSFQMILECVKRTVNRLLPQRTTMHCYTNSLTKHEIPMMKWMRMSHEEIMTIHQNMWNKFLGIVTRRRILCKYSTREMLFVLHTKTSAFVTFECWFSGHFVFIRLYP